MPDTVKAPVPSQAPVVEMTDISISFPGVKALDGVDFRMFPGEVHSLMGENGAGKSTLIKALTGVYSVDSGVIRLGGEQVTFSEPAQAQAAGISTVYQEVNLLREPHRRGERPARTRAPALRWHQLAGDASPGGGDPRGPQPRRRSQLAAQLALAGRPAAGRHRPRHRHQGQGADPRRAHLEPRPRGGRRAVPRDPLPEGVRASRSCSSATSSTRSTRSATGSPSCATGSWWGSTSPRSCCASTWCRP